MVPPSTFLSYQKTHKVGIATDAVGFGINNDVRFGLARFFSLLILSLFSQTTIEQCFAASNCVDPYIPSTLRHRSWTSFLNSRSFPRESCVCPILLSFDAEVYLQRFIPDGTACSRCRVNLGDFRRLRQSLYCNGIANATRSLGKYLALSLRFPTSDSCFSYSPIWISELFAACLKEFFVRDQNYTQHRQRCGFFCFDLAISWLP